MGIGDMHSNGFDADASRYERENRLNPAEFAPGQDATFQQDIFATSSVPANTGEMGDIFGSDAGGGDIFGGQNDIFGGQGGNSFDAFGGAGLNMQNGMNPMGVQGQQQGMSEEDKFWNAVGTGAKGTMNFFKDFTSSFKEVTPLFWQKYGYKAAIVGVVALGIGIVLRLFGVKDGLQLAIGGCLTSAVGVMTMMFNTEKAKTCSSDYKSSNNTITGLNTQPDVGSTGFDDFSNNEGTEDWGSSQGDDWGNTSDDDWNDSDDDWGDSDDDYSSDDEDEDWDFDDNAFDSGANIEQVSKEDALNEMQVIDKGMYTRQYLWDMFTKVLPTMKPNFATMREIDEDDDSFLEWGDSLREAAQVAGCKEESLPELLRLQENLFTIILTCDRPVGFKPDAVGQELANIYAYQDGEFNAGVFSKVDTVGSKCIITIFTGASAMISLKDMMLVEKDFFLNADNTIPVVLGVNQLGKVIKADFRKLESIIVTGMPRSGKSWFVQAVLTQMCAFLSPKELTFYICDPKEGISDFKSFCLPHVKKFVSGDAAIVKTLKNIVRVEGPRRKKLIGDAGFVNIWDYKERYPDVEIPILYVVIDEVVTLAERMDKEVKKEFMGYLIELISQLPALGIRAFLVPHVIKNDIIPKTATDLVPCKISVKGDADHIEKATGSKPKDFPYKLSNAGDMAVKLSNVPETMYVHGPALTKSNPENNELFDYMRRVWGKLEPETLLDSVAANEENEKANEEVLKRLQVESEDGGFNPLDDDSDEDFDLFG